MKRLTLPLLLLLLPAPAASGHAGQSLEDFRQQVGSLVASYSWNEARGTIRRALQSFPDDAYLLMMGAALESRVGDWSDGLPLLERALLQQLDPDLLRLAASLRLQQGERVAARQLLTRALEIAPRDALTRYQAAYVELVDGDEARAREQISRAVKLEPDNARYLHLYALVLERLGERDAAYRQLRQAQRVAPTDTRLLLRLSDREKHRGRLEQALEYLDLAAELDPENPLYPGQAAELYDRLGRHPEAAESRQRAHRLEEAFDAYRAALKLAAGGDPAAAVEILQPAVEAHPEFHTGGLFLGKLYRDLGEQEKALEIYLELLRRDPARSEAREELAWIRAASGDLSAAVETLQQGSARSLNELLLEGHRSLQEAKWSEAIDYFRQVEARYPLDPRLLQLISFTLNEMGEVQEALNYLEKAHGLNPADPGIVREARAIRVEHGLDKIEARQFAAAEAVFRSLVQEEADEPEHRFHLAYALQRQGRIEEAIAQYRRGLQNDPAAEWARVNLAACLYSTGRQAEATSEWKDLVRRHETPEYVYHLGLSLIRELQLEEGWRLVRRAAAEGHPPAQRLLARARRH